MKKRILFLWLGLSLIPATTLKAEMVVRQIEYSERETILEGFLAYNSVAVGPRPGVLIIHQWKGITEYEKGRAVQLARLGYVAPAAGSAYDERADRRSWAAMRQFFDEIFK